MLLHQPAGAMTGLRPDVKWGLEGVPASHNLPERTAIAVLTDTITTLSASVSSVFLLITYCIPSLPNEWVDG